MEMSSFWETMTRGGYDADSVFCSKADFVIYFPRRLLLDGVHRSSEPGGNHYSQRKGNVSTMPSTFTLLTRFFLLFFVAQHQMESR